MIMNTVTPRTREPGRGNGGTVPDRDQIERLARACEAAGLGADFARQQPRDTAAWDAVATELDRLAGDGAR